MCKHNACIGWLVRVLQYESIMQYTAGGIFTWLNSYYILLSISPLIFWSRDQCTTCTCPWAPRIVPPTHWASFHSNTNSKHWRKSEIDYYPAADLWMCILRAFGCAVGISCSMYAVLMQLQMCVCVSVIYAMHWNETISWPKSFYWGTSDGACNDVHLKWINSVPLKHRHTHTHLPALMHTDEHT